METTFERGVESRNAAWLLLVVAILCEIGGAIGLRFSAGFTVLLPTILALGAFFFALFLVSRVMQQLPVSIAYPIWAGGGTAGVALIGLFVLGDEVTAIKIAGIALIMIGVVLVNAASEKRSGC